MVFIIEHLDPRVWKWSFLEYSHISSLVGKTRLWFTNVKREGVRLKRLGLVFSESVTSMELSKVCILDSTGAKTLSAADAKKFDYFVFGGVLGDVPEVDKSLEIIRRLPKAAVRNLGAKQMSTDTAVLVAKRILGGEKMKDIPFIDSVELEVGKDESVILPYRYVLKQGKPVLAPGLAKKLLTQKGF